MDYETLAKELIRALRGKRSQVALSRRLRYGSNVVRTWEAGRRFPSAWGRSKKEAEQKAAMSALIDLQVLPPGTDAA